MAKPLDPAIVASIIKNSELQDAAKNKNRWPTLDMKTKLLTAARNGDETVRLGKTTYTIKYPDKQPYNDGEQHVFIRPLLPWRYVPCGWFSLEKLAKDTMVL